MSTREDADVEIFRHRPCDDTVVETCLECGLETEIHVIITRCFVCRREVRTADKLTCPGCGAAWQSDNVYVEGYPDDLNVFCSNHQDPSLVWYPIDNSYVPYIDDLHPADYRYRHHVRAILYHHTHVKNQSLRLMESDPRYGSKIPVPREFVKRKAINGAARRLIRAIARAVWNGHVPEDVSPADLVRAFRHVENLERQTLELISATAREIEQIIEARRKIRK